ncbi:MAG: dockerin type I repeat-containing protein, partial [Clostridia bacterium]|nr:dockerin type I repeat-containing protein [Clostridia bacterium]
MKPIASLLLIFALLFTTMSYVFAQQTNLLYGDVDGDQKIAAADALAVLQTVVGKRQLTPQQEILADVSGDKGVQADDALWILKYVVGKATIFPAADQPNGAFGLTQAQMDEFAPLLEGLFTDDTAEVIEMEG